MKVAINSCFGGFGLSPLAKKRYLELNNKKCYFFKHTLSLDCPYELIDIDKIEQFYSYFTFTIPNPNDFQPKELQDYNFSEYQLNRSDPKLIQTIEELKEESNGDCAELKIVEIPDDVDYEISDHDGFEHVAEKHRIWS
jgi:hypothetical protein